MLTLKTTLGKNDPGSRKVKNDEFSQEILNKGNQLFFPSLI